MPDKTAVSPCFPHCKQIVDVAQDKCVVCGLDGLSIANSRFEARKRAWDDMLAASLKWVLDEEASR